MSDCERQGEQGKVQGDLHLLTTKDQTLLDWWYTLFLFDTFLDTRYLYEIVPRLVVVANLYGRIIVVWT